MIKTFEKPKTSSKLVKQKTKTKYFKDEKKEADQKIIWKDQSTLRKVSVVKDDYQILYKKTQKILKEYKERQEKW